MTTAFCKYQVGRTCKNVSSAYSLLLPTTPYPMSSPWHLAHSPSILVAQVGSVCLSVTLRRYSVHCQVLLPGSDRVKMGLTVGLGMTVLLCTWSTPTAEPRAAFVAKADSFSEFLLQSLQNPVNLATQSTVAKTASDVPYLLTEWDLSQRVRIAWLTMQGQRKAPYSWIVYEDAGILPVSNANCDLKLGQATVMLVFHCWLLHTSYQAYMLGKIY